MNRRPSANRLIGSALVLTLAGAAAVALHPGMQSAHAALAAPAAAAPAPKLSADAAHPAVIELYQSQGCSDCPPALAVLQKEADRPDLIALSFAVTYWDQLGWKDKFAQPAFTQRQWDYAHANHRPQVATPQVVVNGRGFVLGSRQGELEQALARYDRGRSGPEITPTAKGVQLSAGKAAAPAQLWVVDYDPRTINVAVGAGENSGATLPHRNIVRSLKVAATWTGAAETVTLPARTAGLKRAVLVQQGVGGPIVAARNIG